MAGQLTDLTRTNRALNYGENRRSGLDLTKAAIGALERLLAGGQVSVSDLFPKDEEFLVDDVAEEDGSDELTVHGDPRARREALRQHSAAVALREEKGVDSYWYAAHVISWSQANKDYRAPLFVAGAELIKIGSGGLFDIKLDSSTHPQINPSLVTYFKVVFNVDLTSGIDFETEEEISLSQIDELALKIVSLAGSVVAVTHSAEFKILDDFNFTMWPMINDLESDEFLHLVRTNPVIMSMLDLDHDGLTKDSRTTITEEELDRENPGLLPLIADANASQLVAIKSAIDGSHLVIQGPPGTGKSQTIANMIALLSSQGKRTLFVAEKRAAILAVTELLDAHGLSHLILPLNAEGVNKSSIKSRLQQNLDTASSFGPTQFSLDRLDRLHSVLRNRKDLLYEVVEPSNFRLIDLIGFWSLVPTALDLEAVLESSSRSWVSAAAGEFSSLIDLAHRMKISGFLDSAAHTSPWASIKLTANTSLQNFEKDLKACGADGISVADYSHLLDIESKTLIEASREYSTVLKYSQAEESLTTELSDETIFEYARAFDLGPLAGQFLRADAPFFERLKKKREFKRLLSSTKSSRDVIVSVVVARIEMNRLSITRPDREKLRSVVDAGLWLTDLASFFNMYDSHEQITLKEAKSKVRRLVADLDGFSRTLEWSRIREALSGLDLGDSKLPLFASGSTQEATVRLLRGAIAGRLVREKLRSGSDLAVIDAQEVAEEFSSEDRSIFSLGAQRVASAAAQLTKERRDANPEADRILRDQLSRRRGGKTIRNLFHEIPDALLAINSCVAMSPLQVSSYLPREALFDVVIFDEASQVAPVEAIAALARARQVIVAGDKHQLPPTNFFNRSNNDGDVELSDTESVLKKLEVLLPNLWLNTHYRSQDDRLIRVSAEHVYWEMSRIRLKTVPSAKQSSDCLRFIQIPSIDPSFSGTRTSGDAEISVVVEEVIRHAAEKPSLSLGVITFSVEHARRIELALDRSRREHRELDQFFSQEGKRKFFVKNIERVQGDERDVIFISTGYQKNTGGRLPQNFGPVNNAEGGYRRVNVMISRAKYQMALFSSFNSGDIKITGASAGVRLLHEFFRYVESGGEVLSNATRVEPEMNPFELSIYEELTKRNLNVIPQLGVSGYWIDFVLTHPDQPGSFVLAVEADGARYHSTPTARERDRLRQEHLEAKGFTFHRIWSTDWFRNREKEINRVLDSYNLALSSFNVAGFESVAHTQQRMAPALATHSEFVFPLIPIHLSNIAIDQIPRLELDTLMRQVKDENPSRSKTEIVEILFRAFGFSRRGSRIMKALDQSFDRN